MNRSKRKTGSHIIGEQAVKFVRSLLPAEWTVRELVPDYGIDLQIELFEKSKGTDSTRDDYDTLGEHLFVQVKGTKTLRIKKRTITPRYNIELNQIAEQIDYQSEHDEIEVAVFNIDTHELVTVQRMGASIPVLLFLVDITYSRLFFVCINDYIDKLLLPNAPNYSDNKYKTIHIPLRNEITTDESSLEAIRFYAKRPKFYAAFQKFSYQRGRLDYVYDELLVETAQYFANILLRYDFWTQNELWYPMKKAHEHLTNLVKTGSPKAFVQANEVTSGHEEDNEESWSGPNSGHRLFTEREVLLFMEIRTLWQQLENLGAMYEEICREWYIPTPLGVVTSYANI